MRQVLKLALLQILLLSSTTYAGVFTSLVNTYKAREMGLYNHFDTFVKQGVPEEALNNSLLFFADIYGQSLLVPAADQTHEVNHRKNRQLVIIDYSKNSLEKRFYLLNLDTGKVEKHLVAHGVNSGGTKAHRFSNVPDSRQTSLGFFITGSMYVGKFGPALKLYGLEASNDKAYERYIVIHGAHYVSPDFIKKRGYLGRSHGCPALEKSVATRLLPKLKEGTLIYAYHKNLAQEVLRNSETKVIQDNTSEGDDLNPSPEEIEENEGGSQNLLRHYDIIKQLN